MNLKPSNISRIVASTLLAASMLSSTPLSASNSPEQGSFVAGKNTFLLNGQPFIVKAAELHYPRIPRPYWEHRIKMCKSLGMNTICIYVFWNIHEQSEGHFDFTGNNDLAAFVRLAQKHGMYVIVRPGPYVCAEWEMGGLPWWLLKKKDIRLRHQDPYFMERLEKFENEVGRQLGSLTIDKGGPIIMVQVENEYGSYDTDKPYVSAVRDIIRRSGFDKVTLFQCDWSSNFTNNGLDDLIWTMNFGTGANIDNEFKRLGELRPESPRMCSEFWSGWFDKWGGRHETRPAKAMVDGMREMLSKNISFSLYMTHGGTNWGHWAGANSPGFAPDVTSYDYDAPINEAGQATPKYHELRAMMQEFSKTKLPAIPKAIPVMSIPRFEFTQVAPFFESLPEAVRSRDTRTMEELNTGWGYSLYTTTLPEISTPGTLRINEAHDYAQVFIDGQKVGTINRCEGEKELRLPIIHRGQKLDIFVEAMGRINFGQAIKDFKGITGKVEIAFETDGHEHVVDLKNWSIRTISDSYATVSGQPFTNDASYRGPGYYKAHFNLSRTADTFINLSSWGKGQVYINGHAIGRFWNIGPQQTLYVPGCWLRKGKNEIIIADILGPSERISEGLSTPIIDQLRRTTPQTHRKEGQNLSLEGETPTHQGTFNSGNGWQEVLFSTPTTGRYVCIEALNSHSGREYACIAEWYMLDAQGNRISREPWRVVYSDSEDISSGNKTADKIFDLQESTYWSTVRRAKFPHYIVIDLGAETSLGGFQYLPRVEQGAPESIRDYRIYVKKSPFKL